jgi:hypothetical protein
VALARVQPTKLHFVLESGHRNLNEVRDIFHATREELLQQDFDILGDFTFAEKTRCNPLMIADLFAHHEFMQKRKQMAFPGEQPFTGPSPEPCVTHLRFRPGGIAELKAKLIEQLKTKNRDPVVSSVGQSS